MSKRKRINPYRQPVTRGEVKALDKRKTDAFLTMALYALCECGADDGFVLQFEEKFNVTAVQISRGVLTPEDMIDVLKNEYQEIIERLNKAFWGME